MGFLKNLKEMDADKAGKTKSLKHEMPDCRKTETSFLQKKQAGHAGGQVIGTKVTKQ